MLKDVAGLLRCAGVSGGWWGIAGFGLGEDNRLHERRSVNGSSRGGGANGH
jgi:hypothetical protein